jgi:hypothetical protein
VSTHFLKPTYYLDEEVVKNEGYKRSNRNGTTGMEKAAKPESIENVANHFFSSLSLACLGISFSKRTD